MLRKILLACAFSTAAMFAGTVGARNVTTLTWYGHAAFRIVTPSGHVLLLDPWVTNPSNKNGKRDLAGIKHVDYILVTHGHFDHIGDTVAIAKRTGAHLVANYDLGTAMKDYLGFPAKQAGFDTLGNSGGTISLLNGEVSITYEPAVHSSNVAVPAENGKPAMLVPGGNPNGFVIRIKNGPTFYDTGDTALFGDMRLIGSADHINVMLACIGDHFTMGPKGAASAVKLVNPDVVIPMHYGTFPVLTGTPQEFRAALSRLHLAKKLRVMKIDVPMAFGDKH